MKFNTLFIICMFRKLLTFSLVLFGFGLLSQVVSASESEILVALNCDGTKVVRSLETGTFIVSHVESNLPGCVGLIKKDIIVSSNSISSTGSEAVATSSQTGISSTGMISEKNTNEVVVENISTGSIIVVEKKIESTVSNCNGTIITRFTDGSYELSKGEPNMPRCVDTSKRGFNPENGPVFDTSSADIVKHRSYLMAKKMIRYVNPVRSVIARSLPTKKSKPAAYLMKNDTVVIEGKETGWVKIQGATVSVTDTQENTVSADTVGKAVGYIASRFIRTPYTTDLVRIGQADQAYWSDIAHVRVAHLVNVREHPWYGAKIKAVLSDKTNLYVISTVDNWSEVISDDRSIAGYIRSDYLVIDRVQHTDDWIGVK